MKHFLRILLLFLSFLKKRLAKRNQKTIFAKTPFPCLKITDVICVFETSC